MAQRSKLIVVFGPSLLLVISVLIGIVTNVVTGGRISWWLIGGLLVLLALAIAVQLTLSWIDARSTGTGDIRFDDGPDRMARHGVNLARTVLQRENETLDQLVRQPLARFGRDDGDQQLPVQWASWTADGPGTDRHVRIDELLEHPRLVILGAPGAGKSILAMQITQQLAARAVSDPGYAAALPIRVNLLDSMGLLDEEALRNPAAAARALDDWLVKKIVQVGVPRGAARQLVDDGRILPVLDGLDEVDAKGGAPKRAQAIIGALNFHSSGRLGTRSVVLTCQTQRYRKLVRGKDDAGRHRTWLREAHVIEILPLAPATVIAEIERRFAGELQPWRPLLDRLRRDVPDDSLVAALGSPLHLSLLIDQQLARGGPESVVPDAAATIQDAVFGRYIEAVARRDTSGRYSAAQIHMWLTRIAGHVKGTSFTVSDLRSAALPRAVRTVTIVLGWIVALLVAGRVVTPLIPPEFANEAGYHLVGTFIGIAGVLPMFGNSFAPRLGLRPLGRRNTWLRLLRRIVERSIAGVAIGASAGLVSGLIRRDPRLDLAIGYTAVFFAAAGAVWGLVRGLDLNPPARTRREFVTQGMICAVAMLALSSAVGAVWYGFVVPELLPVGAGFGLLAGFGLVGLTVWPTYLVACLMNTVLRGLLMPPRPAAFLDWAHEAGLIRATGNDDQFRHSALRDWLLTTHRH